MKGEKQDGVVCCTGTLRAMFDRPELAGVLRGRRIQHRERLPEAIVQTREC
jgi:hypothetical protein